MRMLVAMLCVLGGCAFLTGSRRGPTERQTITVQDGSGKPLAGADVYAIEMWTVARGAMGTSRGRVHGPLRTGSHGKVRVKIGTGSRVFYLAKYPDWPSQTGTRASPKVIVLGPPRDVSGEIVLPAGCPPGIVSVTASKYQQVETDWADRKHWVKPVAAVIGADLRFNLRGLGPPPYAFVLRACGRVSWVVEGADRSAQAIRLSLEKSLPDGEAKTQTSFAPFRTIQLQAKARTDDGRLLVPFEAGTLWISPDGRRLVGSGGSQAIVAEDGKATTLDGSVRLAADTPPATAAWSIEATGRSAYYVWFPSEASPRRLAATCSVLTVRSAAAVCGDYSDWQKKVLHLVQQGGPLTTLVTDGGHYKLTDERLTYRAPKPGGEIVRDLSTGRDQHVPVEPQGVDAWVHNQLEGRQKVVSEDGRFVAGVLPRDQGSNLVLLDVVEQKATPLPLRASDQSLSFAGPWLLGVEVAGLAHVGDGFAVRTDTGAIQQLAMGIEAEQRDVVVRGDVVVQRESGGGRLIASRPSTGERVALGKLKQIDVGTDGQWFVGYDDDDNTHVVRTDGSVKLSLGRGIAKLTQDGRGVLFREHAPYRGTLELIDFEHAWRMHVAEGVQGFTSLGDGRVVYSTDRGPAGRGIYIQIP